MVRSSFLEFSSKIKFFPLPSLTKRSSTLASQEEEVKKRTVRFGSFCNLVARDLLQFPHKNLNEVELKHDRCIGAFQMGQRTYFAWRCQCQRFFFFLDVSISVYSKVNFLRNLLNETCFIELRSIVRQRGPLKVSNFRLETINMNSVFDLLREMNKGVSF